MIRARFLNLGGPYDPRHGFGRPMDSSSHLGEHGAVLLRVSLFDVDECADFAARVQRMRRLWSRRHPEAGSFTLGAASYLDVPETGMHGYLTATVRTRNRLASTFGDLYARVQAELTRHLGIPIRYHPQLALPGFHIFETNAHTAALTPKIHFDLQHEYFDWADPEALADGRRLSFTVPIALPAAGGGLYVWPLTSQDLDGLDDAARKSRVVETEREVVEYRLGEMVAHSGDQLHQIVADRPAGVTEVRLTFQGHAIQDGDQWWLYW